MAIRISRHGNAYEARNNRLTSRYLFFLILIGVLFNSVYTIRKRIVYISRVIGISELTNKGGIMRFELLKICSGVFALDSRRSF